MIVEGYYKVLHWCPVCDGKGGWDKRNFIARFRDAKDTPDSYMWCIYCGPSNIILPTKPKHASR